MEDNNQNISSQPSNPVENQNISNSISSKSSTQGTAPFLLVLIIVAVVVAAGGWFLLQNNQATAPQVESKSSRQYQQVSPTPAQAVDDQVKSLKVVSSSDDLSTIEKDLNSTDFAKLDQETTEINQNLTDF